MTVKVTDKEKQWLKVAEMPIVRKIQKICREDETTVSQYAEQVMRYINPHCGFEIHRPLAVIAGNKRVNDRYAEGTGNFDVWVSFLAFSEDDGVYDVGIYLTDIWDLGEDTYKEILTNKAYITVYNKSEKAVFER